MNQYIKHYSCLLEESENAQQDQMEQMHREFEDLTNSKREAIQNLNLERQASKTKDEIIKSQDAKILDLEVSYFHMI